MNTHPKIEAKAIVFDQGNTLIMDPFLSVIELQKEKFQEIFRRYNLSTDASIISKEWIKANKEIDYPYIGHFIQEEPIIQCALRKMGIKEDIAAILALDLLKEYRNGLKKSILRDPRTKEVADVIKELHLKGKRLGIFSNDRAIGLGLVLHTIGISHLFQFIVTSESIGIEKPDPRVFEYIKAHFQLSPEEIVYIGDDPIRDIDAAKAQGLKAIQYKVDTNKYTERWRDYTNSSKYEPDAVILKFSELLNILI